MTTEPTAVEALLPMPTAKQRFIDDMREMADFIEQSELDGNARFSSPDIYIFSRDSLEFGRDVHAIGSCKKSADGSYVNATKRIGGMVLQVTTTHEKVWPSRPKSCQQSRSEWWRFSSGNALTRFWHCRKRRLRKVLPMLLLDIACVAAVLTAWCYVARVILKRP